MADSIDVLATLKMVYMIYALIAMSIIGRYAFVITRSNKSEGFLSPTVFRIYVGVLLIVGTGLHFLTYNTVPWVSTDLNRANISPAKVFNITFENHKITLDQNPMKVECNTFVVFNATSRDLVYGFGIFRQNHTMVTQMQVVPQSRNDLMWRFSKNGTYYIRSTEYSGPKGHKMIIENAVVVSGCDTDDTMGGK